MADHTRFGAIDMAPTISETIDSYLQSVSLARSENTARTYQNAMSAFRATLADHGYATNSIRIPELSEDAIAWFAADLKAYSPATERLYLTAATGFYEYLVGENLAELNLPRVRLLIRQRARRPGQRLPQFYKEEIEQVLAYAKHIADAYSKDHNETLRNLRDRAFLITLADTGLRVHEACRLRRGDVDWKEGKALIIGKGNREDIIRFSRRSMEALSEYQKERARLDGASGRPLTSLPLFAQHGKGAGDKVKPITTRTGQNIVNQRVREALGDLAVGIITPHSFRHYFVTTVLQASGNLKLAQELARHRNIQVTQRYAHLADDELDRGYWDIFK
jgi:site-specific recombinase XerD